MRLAICIILMTWLVSLLPRDSAAQYLSYRETFWGKMEYTRDGTEFQGFGGGWKDLFREVESNDEARRLLKDARNLHYVGEGCTIGGAVLLGFVAGIESREGHIDDGYWIAGAAFTILGIGCSIAGELKLNKGFLVYNKGAAMSSDKSDYSRRIRLAVAPSQARLIFCF